MSNSRNYGRSPVPTWTVLPGKLTELLAMTQMLTVAPEPQDSSDEDSQEMRDELFSTTSGTSLQDDGKGASFNPLSSIVQNRSIPSTSNNINTLLPESLGKYRSRLGLLFSF